MKAVILSLLLINSLTVFTQTHQRMVKYAGPLKDSISEKFAAVWGYTKPDGKEYAVLGGRTSIRIFDITNPRNPNKVFDQANLSTTSWREFKTYRNYLYGVCDNCDNSPHHGLFILNLDSLSNGNMRQQVDFFKKAHNLYIDTANAKLYIVGALNLSTNTNAGIFIYSLSNPATPVLLRWYNTGRYSHDIFVRNNIVYSSEGYSGTYIYDMNDINNISLLGSTSVRAGYHHSVWLTDDNKYMYSAREIISGIPSNQPYPMTAYSLINNTPVNPVDFVPTYNNSTQLAIPHNPHLYKEKLFVSYYQDGVLVYDVSKANDPRLIAFYDTFHPNLTNIKSYDGSWGVFPFYSSGSIAVSDITNGLYILGLVSEVDHSEDIVLNSPGAGFLLSHHNGLTKVSVNNSGQVSLQHQFVPTSTTSKTKDADLKTQKNIVLRSPNGDYFKLIYSAGNLVALPYNPDLSLGILYDGDFMFEQSRGPLFTDQSSNQWHRLKIDLAQNLTFFLMY